MFLNWESPSSLIGAQLLCVDWTSGFLLVRGNRVYLGSNNTLSLVGSVQDKCSV